MTSFSLNYPVSSRTAGNVCDALVVGGGPAGLAAGIALRQSGLDVVVADALVPPIDKACGEGLMPDSVREIERLGVDLEDGCSFSGIRFVDGKRVATARFPAGMGVGIRRVDLHRNLVGRAEAAGVRMKWGARVDLGRTQVTLAGETWRYRYLVGADGEASRVRHWAGLDAGSVRSERLGFRRHYRIAPWSDVVEVHWSERGQVYVTPVAGDEICVAAVTRQRGLGFEGILQSFPDLRSKLEFGEAIGRNRGSLTTTRRLRRVTRENVALVGDASGSSDAITGTGLASAFRQALLLGTALGRDAMGEYEAGHAKILRLPQTMASVLLAMDRLPWCRQRVIAALAGGPDLFTRLLAVHIGEMSVARFAATHGIKLAFRLLFPHHAPEASLAPASELARAKSTAVSVSTDGAVLAPHPKIA